MQPKTILAALVGLALAAPAAAEPLGFLAALKGRTELRPSGGEAFSAAEIDQDVNVGDALRTGRGGWAKVVLRDDTTFAVDEETEVVFDRYAVGNLAAGDEPSRVELLRGHLRTKVGETFGDSTRLKLRTPTAVVGVKGTEWLTWALPDHTWVCVIAGIVAASNRDPAVAGSLDIGPGECARIGRSEAPLRSPHPEHLEPTGMRLQPIPQLPSFPARFDRTDRTPIEPNDVPPRIEIPEPPPVRRLDDTPPSSNNNPRPITPPSLVSGP